MSPAELIEIIGLGITVFVSTNIDDIILLAVLFSDPHLSSKAIVVGQFIGMAVLIAGSGLAALASVALPPGWTALLGVVPLALGIVELRSLRRSRSEGGDDDDDEGTSTERLRAARSPTAQVIAVTAITIANGGDNLGVNVSVFARKPSAIPVYVVVFAVLTGVWCLLGHWLVNNPLTGKTLRRYGQVALPFVLIGLGVWLLLGVRPLLSW